MPSGSRGHDLGERLPAPPPACENHPGHPSPCKGLPPCCSPRVTAVPWAGEAVACPLHTGTSPSPPPQHLACHPMGTRRHGEEGRQHCTCRWNKATPLSYWGLPIHQLKLCLSPSCKSNKLLVFMFLTRRTGDRRGSQRGPGGAPCPQTPPQSTQPPFSPGVLAGSWSLPPQPLGVCSPGTC